MNTKLILLSIFTLAYFLGAQWWYSNQLAGVCCGASQVASADASTVAAAAVAPLAFEPQNVQPLLGEEYADYVKNSILNGMTQDNILQITGRYFADEQSPEGYDNMGMARAAAIRDLLQDELAADRIVISSRQAGESSPQEGGRFEAALFNWMAAPDKEETTIVALKDEITIYFPFNSSVKDKNSKVDDYLKKLVERLKQTSEKVSITGHTDDIGEVDANQSLGLRRAESIRDILIAYGVANDRITVNSKGELQAATTNETEQGRHRNRRTVLRIN
ncbi:MAG: OmpA family protein [Bacteroidota bacterium]